MFASEEAYKEECSAGMANQSPGLKLTSSNNNAQIKKGLAY
jgi:hypothetical protein